MEVDFSTGKPIRVAPFSGVLVRVMDTDEYSGKTDWFIIALPFSTSAGLEDRYEFKAERKEKIVEHNPQP